MQPAQNGTAQTAREWIEAEGLRLGLSRIGFAPVDPPPRAALLDVWIDSGYAANMDWLVRSAEIRKDLRGQFPWARTVVVAALNYDRPNWQVSASSLAHRISRYARGRDYHNVLGKRLRKLADSMRRKHEAQSRVFVDASPIMERLYAEVAGLGWQGKHSLLIHPKDGSYFFLGAMLTDLDLAPVATPRVDHCGTCTRCIDACPTGAIVQPYTVDSNRCISYRNIEHRGEAEADWGPEPLHGWLHGCDICQEVCPWVKRARARGVEGDPAFDPLPVWTRTSVEQARNWSETDFDGRTEGSPVRRQRWDGWRRNVGLLGKD